MKSNFEAIQNGNPYRLTKEQHFIPKSQIKRFENSNKKVFCKNFKSKNQKIIEINSNDSIFKVQRLWAEFAEKGYMKNIEDSFNKLVDCILSSSIKEITNEQSKIICDMYSLWERRVYHIEEFNKNPDLFIKLNGIDGENYSQDEKEKIESMYMSCVNESGEISNRDLIASQIQIFILNSPYKEIQWGILKSKNKFFVMPSNPNMTKNYENATIIFPISPNYCLVPTKMYQELEDNDVDSLNKIMIDNAKWFYFSQKQIITNKF